MFTARWRWNASRALAVLRFSGGRKTPPPIQRMRSDDLLAAVFPDQAACGENIVGDIRIPDHPLVKETIRDCLHEAMDLDGLKGVLDSIRNGVIRAVAVDTAEPSPFSHEILNANPYAYLDDAPLEERRARAVQMRRSLGVDSGEVGALDPAAIDAVRSESWPVVRNADELHDALLTLFVLQPQPEWSEMFEELAGMRRATTLHTGGAVFWAPAERLSTLQRLYTDAAFGPVIESVERTAAEDRDTAATEVVRGWMESTGPMTAMQVSERLRLTRDLVDVAFGRLEANGEILRGRFTPAAREAGTELEWCNRRLLARIHRLTIGRLRREIEPVSSADFMRFLFSWQHVASGTQLHGVDGVFQILKQLQGYEISASSWETEVLPRRVARYAPEMLDQLCLSGEIMWGRLSPHPAFAVTVESSPRGRRVRPTRVAPVAIFLRDDAPWLLQPPVDSDISLSHAAREVHDALGQRGASFLPELVKSTGRLASEVEDGLWELAAAGLVTADGYENLRALVDPRRRGSTSRTRGRARHAAGRWALLVFPDPPANRNTAFARQLLDRWGVVFRDLLARESLVPPWRDLLLELRRMEAKGEIRGGRFVNGFPGEQFARPEAVDLLRALRRKSEGNALRIAASDPLNLAGIVVPGPRISPLAGQAVELLTA